MIRTLETACNNNISHPSLLTFKDESDYKATHSLRRNTLLQTCSSTVGMDFIPFLQWMMFCQCL